MGSQSCAASPVEYPQPICFQLSGQNENFTDSLRSVSSSPSLPVTPSFALAFSSPWHQRPLSQMVIFEMTMWTFRRMSSITTTSLAHLSHRLLSRNCPNVANSGHEGLHRSWTIPWQSRVKRRNLQVVRFRVLSPLSTSVHLCYSREQDLLVTIAGCRTLTMTFSSSFC